MEILTQEQSALNSLVSDNFAISRYHDGKLISLVSGVYFEVGKAVAAIAFMSPDSNEMDIIKAVNTLDLISKEQSDNLRDSIPRWVAFEVAFQDSEGVKLKMMDVINKFCDHEPVTPKQFYIYFNAWVKENQYKVNFTNRFGNRRVVLVK